MGFPRRQAQIKFIDGRIVCHITTDGSFVSSTVHDTKAAAIDYARSKKATVVAEAEPEFVCTDIKCACDCHKSKGACCNNEGCGAWPLNQCPPPGFERAFHGVVS